MHWKSPLHLVKGKGSRDLENVTSFFVKLANNADSNESKDNLSPGESKPFSIYFGPKDYSARLTSDQMQHLLSSARDILLHSNNGLRHLATMNITRPHALSPLWVVVGNCRKLPYLRRNFYIVCR